MSVESAKQSSSHPALLLVLSTVLFGTVVTLYPQENESRSIRDLNGLWNFRYCSRTDPNAGFREEWYRRSLKLIAGTIVMPVPSSFNDITQTKTLRDHVGWVWYDRDFYVTHDWMNKRVVLRFESVYYYAQVWLNGHKVMEHEGGHLPFEADISTLLDFSSENRITVAVNNTLTPYTLPCGHIVYPQDPANYPPGYFRQELIFDFFNYAGIHRAVLLYTTSAAAYVSDVVITTDNNGVVSFAVDTVLTSPTSGLCHVEMTDADRTDVFSSMSCVQSVKLDKPRLWWPVGMNNETGHQYELKVSLLVNGTVQDTYRQKFGMRTVSSRSDGFKINEENFYFTGFGKHEDFHIFGRGFNLPLMVKDFNLIQWTGGNSFRTSHYPYATEVLDYADEHGIVIIDESPAVGLHEFSNKTLVHHLRVMEELISRDRNHPSVVMWSVANEPKSYDPKADAYFRQVIEHTRHLDPTRLITFVIGGSNASLDKAAKFVDVLCVNHYFGWYSDPGHTELIQRQLIHDIKQWFYHFKKPVIVTEYGADTIAGLHTSPSFIFSEEYHIEFMAAYHKAFDRLSQEYPVILVGEMVWNFADFMTDQQINRVWGNRKGIFTRERQPKMAAHFLRRRYRKLNKLAGSDTELNLVQENSRHEVVEYPILPDPMAFQL